MEILHTQSEILDDMIEDIRHVRQTRCLGGTMVTVRGSEKVRSLDKGLVGYTQV